MDSHDCIDNFLFAGVSIVHTLLISATVYVTMRGTCWSSGYSKIDPTPCRSSSCQHILKAPSKSVNKVSLVHWSMGTLITESPPQHGGWHVSHGITLLNCPSTTQKKREELRQSDKNFLPTVMSAEFHFMTDSKLVSLTSCFNWVYFPGTYCVFQTAFLKSILCALYSLKHIYQF